MSSYPYTGETVNRPTEPPMIERPRPQARPRHPQPASAYQRGITTAAVAAAGVLWLALWLLNGYFSVIYFMALGVHVAVACTAQLIMTLLQIGLWRSGIRALMWTVLFPVGLLDVYTSARGIQIELLSRHIDLGLLTSVLLCTTMAMVIALAPEHMLRKVVRWLNEARRLW